MLAYGPRDDVQKGSARYHPFSALIWGDFTEADPVLRFSCHLFGSSTKRQAPSATRFSLNEQSPNPFCNGEQNTIYLKRHPGAASLLLFDNLIFQRAGGFLHACMHASLCLLTEE